MKGFKLKRSRWNRLNSLLLNFMPLLRAWKFCAVYFSKNKPCTLSHLVSCFLCSFASIFVFPPLSARDPLFRKHQRKWDAQVIHTNQSREKGKGTHLDFFFKQTWVQYVVNFIERGGQGIKLCPGIVIWNLHYQASYHDVCASYARLSNREASNTFLTGLILNQLRY